MADQQLNSLVSERGILANVEPTASAVASNTVILNKNLVTPLNFGNYSSNPSQYPNDCVQIDVYNFQDLYLESIDRATYYKINSNILTVDIEKELSQVNYLAGDFNISVRTIRNYFGSADDVKVYVQEISGDRTEVRIVPGQLQNGATNLESFFSSDFFKLDKQSVLAGLQLFSSPIESVNVVDYVQDFITFPDVPYSVIIKLAEPLPNNIRVDSEVWIAQEVTEQTTDKVKIIPAIPGKRYTQIAGPNFDVNAKKGLLASTEYKNWDELLQYNSSSLLTNIFSGSFVEGISLNVDYTRFENFVHFSKAEERLHNFKFKVGLLENYNDIISSLSTDLTGTVSGSSSGSTASTTQINTYRQKREALIGAFDGFERYLYYESSSYVSNSFGEFLDMAWPKSTSSKPYTLYSVTSSQVENWFDGIITSASLYDNINPNNLAKYVPAHISENSDNEVGLVLINMIGHYYDIVFSYVKQMNLMYDRQESLTEGFAKDLVYHIADNLGLDFSNGNTLQELWSYTLGLSTGSSYDNTLNLSAKDRTNEVWKRIINNLPLLLKTKGTERSVRALINCFGIPSTIMRIREFGGPEDSFSDQSRWKHDRFYYSTILKSENSGTHRSIHVPWKDYGNALNTTTPSAFSFRYRSATALKLPQIIMERSDGSDFRMGVLIGSKQGVDYAKFILANGANIVSASINVSSSNTGSNLFDNRWLTYYVYRDPSAGKERYDFYVGHKADYGEDVILYSASVLDDPRVSGSWRDTLNASHGGLFFPAYRGTYGVLTYPSTDFTGTPTATNYATGSIQEIRLWTGSRLTDNQLRNTILNPTTYQGYNYETDPLTAIVTNNPGSTSSFNDLLHRQTLGTDNVKVNYYSTTSLDGEQPNKRTNISRQTEFLNFPINQRYHDAVSETNYMVWPDASGNRQVNNKIRIESVISTSDQLFLDNSAQASLQDLQPIDSPRLGVYFSPTNEYNEDIAEQFGGISLDNFIGSYNDIYEPSYPDLDGLHRSYLRKYRFTGRNDTQTYIRLLRHYDAALFDLIKKFAPYRANLQTGLVIEPHILHRPKIAVNRPETEDETYETTLELPEIYTVGGNIQDADGDTRDQDFYVWEAQISQSLTEPIGDYPTQVEGSIATDGDQIVNVSTLLNEYNNTQVEEQGAGLNTLYDTVNTRITSYGRDAGVEGSQYRFPSWYTTGSGTYIGFVSNSAGLIYADSIGEDYWNPLGVTVLDNVQSERYTTTEFPYNYGADLLRGSGSIDWTSTIQIYTGSYFSYPLASDLVFRFTPSTTGGSAYWAAFTNTLVFVSGPSATGSFTTPILLHPIDSNFVYRLSFTTSTGLPYKIQFGSGSSIYEYTGVAAANDNVVIESKASNSLLFFETSVGAGNRAIDNLKITINNPLNAQIQDYHVGDTASVGLKNQKYDGCKLTSSDFNEDSPDTIDGGPVIVVTEGPSVRLNVDPSQEGTYTFR